ncbi:hypothetical protein [Microbulbifer agarilyticus]|uniref:hypothetical protein n=1 Tax=Microbulbifer agarilyticus TaxID=260552 RepID=UPI001CD50D32|nr:hypothetical protein [Microbulbifer agarilyticus]MCA0892037.1 hypothetical protein [Microbulbifer agarilyticus]
MYKTLISVITLAVSISVSVQASDRVSTHWENNYFRGGFGIADMEHSYLDINDSGIPVGLTLVGGLPMNSYISFELGYYDFGKTKSKLNTIGGDLESYGEVYENRGDIFFSGRNFATSVRVHTDISRPFYLGIISGYHFMKIRRENDYVVDHTIDWDVKRTMYGEDFDFYYPEKSGLESTTQEYKYKSTYRDHDLFYGVFAGWNSPIGEITFEYNQFNSDIYTPVLFTTSYIHRF